MSDDAPTTPLRTLGYDEEVADAFAPWRERGSTLGRVVRVDRGKYFLATEAANVLAELSLGVAHGSSRPVVGDWVAVDADQSLEIPQIEAVLPRRSVFERGDPGKPTTRQVVAANIDWVFLVHALGGDGPNPRRLERELVLAWESGARPVVVLNKTDLVPDVAALEEARAQAEAVAIGTPVHFTSTVTGEGVEDLRAYTSPGHTVALLGASGVGKSTIVNRLAGQELQDTGEVREFDSKGRHTTIARELIPLPGGGVVIDTPGMRALAMWEADSGLAKTFPDVADRAEGCRFADCGHRGEPGCAVLAAVEAGVLPRERLDSYLKLQAELDDIAERQVVRERAQRGRRR